MNDPLKKLNNDISDLRKQVAQLIIEKEDLWSDFKNAKLSDAKLKTISDISSNALLFTDRNGLIVDCNNSSYELFEYQSKHDFTGNSFNDFIVPYRDASINLAELIAANKATLKQEITLQKRNGNSFPAMLSASTIDSSDGLIAIIIQDISHTRDFATDEKQQIDLLARLSIFNYELKQAQTCNELKHSLCNQCVLLTEANEAWFLSNISQNQIELVSSNNQICSGHFLTVDESILTKTLLFLENPKDVYVFENETIITFSEFKHTNKIAVQYVIGSKQRSGNWNLLGLNYDSEAKTRNQGDLEFVRNIFSQVFSALENLSTYEKLIENENRFRTIIEKSDNVICVLDKDLKYTYVSPSIKNALFTPDDLLGKKAGNFTHPDDKHLYLEALKAILNKEDETIVIPSIRTIKKDGTFTYSSIDVTNMMHQQGIEGYVIKIRDINERIDHENQLRQSEEKFRNIFNYSNDSIYIADLQGNFLEINNVAVARTGVDKSEFLKTKIQNFVSGIPIEKANAFVAKIIEEGSATAEDCFVNKEGDEIHFQINGRLIDYNNTKAILLRSLDITGRKNAERQILDTIIQTEENERARFARELHDGIGPFLSAIKFFLQALSREDNTETRNSITSKAMESIDEIIRNVKDISNNISPRVLNHFGIIPAINTLVKRVSDSNIAININSNIEGLRFNDNLEINTFRIYSELINNSLKHAKATKLEITIMKDINTLTAIYTDNGIGFNYDKNYEMGKGSGLYNIENRVKSLNGKYEFATDKDYGVKFKAIFEI